ncbi:MAG: DUF2752 domain-containing protein [Prevotellaceae bacterium]|jgi:hypothetical protein|nr:DUF2752 domain-containing protein [Prevotellaceae bacterium]
MEISFIPKWLIKYVFSDYSAQFEANILISNAIIIITFAIFRDTLVDFISLLPHFCLFDKIFDVQCPFCGITRGFCELAKGHVSPELLYWSQTKKRQNHKLI